jgi:hypothetical protein
MKFSLKAKFVTLAVFLPLVGACGRPATEKECTEILRRTAELEMKQRLGDKNLIESELAEIEKSMRPQMMKKCVGKRITESALACVRAAKTSEELSQECFR